MKKGFTLIELLVSIAILGLIMLIAIPRIGDVINESKNNAYLETVSTIENAAQLYRIRNLHEFSDVVGEKRVVTIKQLQDAGFLKSNIQDPRYGTTITDGDVFVVLQSNGEYTYTHTNASYVKDNLVLWYDALWHGTNQNTWLDRSGNNLSGTLTGFLQNASSGWQSDHLLTSKVETVTTPYLINSSYTISVLFSPQSLFDYNTIWDNSNSADINECWIYATGQLRARNNTNLSLTPGTLSLNQIYEITFNVSTATNTAKIYLNGELSSTSGVFVPTFTGSTLNINGSLNTKGHNRLYSIKVYSKALTDAEIKQNYLTDKERFNF